MAVLPENRSPELQRYYDIKEDPEKYATLLEAQRAYRSTWVGRIRQLLGGAKSRARSVGAPFELDEVWLGEQLQSQNFRCARTGVPFDLSLGGKQGRKLPYGPTLDRIDPAGGYTRRNTQVVCNIYNIAKQQWSIEVVEEFAKAVVENA